MQNTSLVCSSLLHCSAPAPWQAAMTAAEARSFVGPVAVNPINIPSRTPDPTALDTTPESTTPPGPPAHAGGASANRQDSTTVRQRTHAIVPPPVQRLELESEAGREGSIQLPL